MSLIIRMDIDRPYGKDGFFRHLLSRIASDLYLPRISLADYLLELKIILEILNEKKKRSFVFFRCCTLPDQETIKLLDKGNHEIGLHLENSRSFETFEAELRSLEAYLGRKVISFSKHGSGGYKYGFHHYAPYEPEKYIEWANKVGMRYFMGNYEEPTLEQYIVNGLIVFPSAFWLEPSYRKVNRFTPEWLCVKSRNSNIVLLFHPDNVIVNQELMNSLEYILENS